MAIEKKKHALLLIVSGTAMLLLITFYVPYQFHNVPPPLEFTLLLLIPIGLILLVLGVFRLLTNAALSISKKLRRSSE